MKKIKLSLAVLTLVVAVAGTTTANAIKGKKVLDWCFKVDPEGVLCTNSSPVECCLNDEGQLINERG